MNELLRSMKCFRGDIMDKKELINLPVIPLKGITVFPNMVISFAVANKNFIDTLETAMKNDEMVFLVSQRNVSSVDIEYKDLYSMGTIVKVKQVFRLPGNITHVIAEGMSRGELINLQENDGNTFADVNKIVDDDYEEDIYIEALMRSATEAFEEYIKLSAKSSNTSINDFTGILSEKNPGRLSDLISAEIHLPQEEKQSILEIKEPIERLKNILNILKHELKILKIKIDIDEKVKSKIEKTQKEYYLREQLKVIQDELGDKDGVKADADDYKERLKAKKYPKEVNDVVLKEIEKMMRVPFSSPESNVIKSYIEWLLDLPWLERTKESIDLEKAEKILDKEHYGLSKVKERIIEFLAVRSNTKNLNAPIICLVGPPGVGKTSIAKSIAKCVNRKYTRISLGGVKDESEIRGHRRTYVGAMPGRIISAIKKAEVSNPLILLDEIDKLSTSYSGDPSAALLEVLDSAQNYSFKDHYIEIPYDLSQVFFICTANSADTIPAPLRDRMEMIYLSSYTSEEKINIAYKYLYAKALKEHGLKKNQLKISISAFEEVINSYTKEAGVRQLERMIGTICRKAVKNIVLGETKQQSVTKNNIEDYLGIKKYKYDKIYEENQIGIVRGLAWTSVGGDTLSIEVNTMKGTGKFEFTGNIGDVMKESAKAAVSFIRSNYEKFNLDDDFYKNTDIHIHIPEGAVPKDGPSAGITMATAMISALTGAYVKNNVAMTGEITIRGRVLPIGGLKEKIIAAKRAGIEKVIIPLENKKDLQEIPQNIIEDLNFVYAKDMNDVLNNVFAEGESIWR